MMHQILQIHIRHDFVRQVPSPNLFVESNRAQGRQKVTGPDTAGDLRGPKAWALETRPQLERLCHQPAVGVHENTSHSVGNIHTHALPWATEPQKKYLDGLLNALRQDRM